MPRGLAFIGQPVERQFAQHALEMRFAASRRDDPRAQSQPELAIEPAIDIPAPAPSIPAPAPSIQAPAPAPAPAPKPAAPKPAVARQEVRVIDLIPVMEEEFQHAITHGKSRLFEKWASLQTRNRILNVVMVENEIDPILSDLYTKGVRVAV